MNLEFVACSGIPRLAWGAVLERGAGVATIYHGEQVETAEKGFFEGAWNGSADVASALRATVVCGTGGALEDGAFRFWAATDNICPIHSIRSGCRLFVSNSPVFTQVLAGEGPDPSYPFYYDDFVRIVRMGFNTKGRLRTASGSRLRLNFGHIMTVDQALRVSFSRHPACDPFDDYASYYRLLSSSVRQVYENAASDERRFPYQPMTACSKGYDANACAVLAARAGCKDAITLVSSEASETRMDSGEEIAKALNLRCITGDRLAFRNLADLGEFCITPHSMYPTYAAFENVLTGRLLTTGSAGGMVWSKHYIDVFEDNRASWANYLSGYGLLEYRLRVGFATLAPARIGSVYNREIHRITNSDEMRSWSIGSNYDKPIARRIVEEAGVDRQAFGMKKMATSNFRFDRPGMQSTRSGSDYQVFMERRARMSNPFMERYWELRHRWRAFLLYRFSSPRPRGVRYTRLRRLSSFLTSRPVMFEWYYVFCYQFSFDKLKDRYRLCSRAGEANARVAGQIPDPRSMERDELRGRTSTVASRRRANALEH